MSVVIVVVTTRNGIYDWYCRDSSLIVVKYIQWLRKKIEGHGRDKKKGTEREREIKRERWIDKEEKRDRKIKKKKWKRVKDDKISHIHSHSPYQRYSTGAYVRNLNCHSNGS